MLENLYSMLVGTPRNEVGGPIDEITSLPVSSGKGLGSRDNESGVTKPLPKPPWLGEAGAERDELPN